jgi:hypothetical protein
VTNLLGKHLFSEKNPGKDLDVSLLDAGIYLISFKAKEATWTAKFVKQ